MHPKYKETTLELIISTRLSFKERAGAKGEERGWRIKYLLGEIREGGYGSRKPSVRRVAAVGSRLRSRPRPGLRLKQRREMHILIVSLIARRL